MVKGENTAASSQECLGRCGNSCCFSLLTCSCTRQLLVVVTQSKGWNHIWDIGRYKKVMVDELVISEPDTGGKSLNSPAEIDFTTKKLHVLNKGV